ncbi:MAG: hypothetical protein M5U30_01260 [Burkholderiaceae bacterium]|nr:hypothetical protein [Burkholderiaceae bacterium]
MTTTILCAGALARPRPATPGDDPGSGTPALAANGALARTIRRARIAGRSRQTALVPEELPHEAWLRECFAVDGAVAACALPARNDVAGPELLVRPVHLHLALDHLVLAPPESLGLDPEEAGQLADRANAVLADEGLRLSVLDPGLWRLGTSDAHRATDDLAALAQLLARSARMAVGRNVDAYLPSGTAARRWRQLANLVQMSWFEHPLNLAREASGRLVVNGLWLEGRAGRPGAHPFARVLAADEVVAGLARRAGIESRPLAADAAADSGALLLAPDFWRRPVADGDTDGWMQAWQSFDRWFDALLATAPRVAAGGVRLVLTGERSTIELLGLPADRWKPWRRLALAALLREDT